MKENLIKELYSKAYYTNKHQAKISEPQNINDFLSSYKEGDSYRGVLRTTIEDKNTHLIVVLDLDTKHNPNVFNELKKYLKDKIFYYSGAEVDEYDMLGGYDIPFVSTKNDGYHIYLKITIATSLIEKYGEKNVRQALKIHNDINIKGVELKTLDITGIGTILPNLDGIDSQYQLLERDVDLLYDQEERLYHDNTHCYIVLPRREEIILTNITKLPEILYTKFNKPTTIDIDEDLRNNLTNIFFIQFFINQAKKNVANSQDYNMFIGTYLNLCCLSNLYGTKEFNELGTFKYPSQESSIQGFYLKLKELIWGDSIYYDTIPEYEDLTTAQEQVSLEHLSRSYEYWVSKQNN